MSRLLQADPHALADVLHIVEAHSMLSFGDGQQSQVVAGFVCIGSHLKGPWLPAATWGQEGLEQPEDRGRAVCA